MVTSTSKLAFGDCFELFDQALEDPIGARIPFTDKDSDRAYGAAMHFRVRCNRARSLDRQDNFKTFADGHPMHGRSQYDGLRLRVLRGEDENDGTTTFWVYVEQIKLPGTVEALSALETDDATTN